MSRNDLSSSIGIEDTTELMVKYNLSSSMSIKDMIIQIIKSRNIGFDTYENRKVTIEILFSEVLPKIEKPESFAMRFRNEDYIFYDDYLCDDENLAFNLAHELGHILLKHFDRNENDMSKFENLDLEANKFATDLISYLMFIKITEMDLLYV